MATDNGFNDANVVPESTTCDTVCGHATMMCWRADAGLTSYTGACLSAFCHKPTGIWGGNLWPP